MNLWEYEDALNKEGYKVIAGTDEAGRGPLYGPVVAGCVVLPRDFKLEGLTDSKKLSEKKREKFYDYITKNTIWAVGIVSAKEIDKINIYEASRKAMIMAINEVRKQINVDYVITDAMPIDLDMDLKSPLSEYYTCEPVDTTIKDKSLWSWKISRPGYKPLILKNRYRVDMRYLGDMNGDGDDTNEFGIRQETNNSEWDFFCIYTYQDGEWKYLIEPYMTYAPIFCNRWLYPKNGNRDSTISYYFNDIRYNGIVCIDTTVAIKPIPISEFDLNKQNKNKHQSQIIPMD